MVSAGRSGSATAGCHGGFSIQAGACAAAHALRGYYLGVARPLWPPRGAAVGDPDRGLQRAAL